LTLEGTSELAQTGGRKKDLQIVPSN
jgi:hypothetical protein